MFEEGKPTWFSLIHNFKPPLLSLTTLINFVKEPDAEWAPKLVLALVLGIKAGLSAWESLQFPVGRLDQET